MFPKGEESTLRQKEKSFPENTIHGVHPVSLSFFFSLTTLLLRDTNSPAPATRSLGVLAAHPETPIVAETTVGSDLLQALKIVTKLRVNTVGQDLRVLAVDNVLLPVEEPGGNFILGRVLHDCDDALELFRGKFTSTLIQVDIGLLANKVGVATANTLDSGHGINYLLLAINIGIEQTKDVLEV